MERTDQQTLNLLLVDDDEDDYILIREMLTDVENTHYQLAWTPTYAEAVRQIAECSWDAVLLDFDLGERSGLDLIHETRHHNCRIPLIVVTGRGSYELDVEAMQAGAAEYVSKNQLNGPFLERVIRYAIEHKGIEEQLEHLVEERTEALQNALEELRVVEEELREENEELAIAIQLVRSQSESYGGWQNDFMVGHLQTDARGVILTADPGAARLLRTSARDLQGRLLSFFVAPQDRPAFARQLSKIHLSPVSTNWNMSLRHVNEELLPCCFSAAFHHNADADRIHWMIHPFLTT